MHGSCITPEESNYIWLGQEFAWGCRKRTIPLFTTKDLYTFERLPYLSPPFSNEGCAETQLPGWFAHGQWWCHGHALFENC